MANERNGTYDIVEFSKLVESIRADEIIRNNSEEIRGFTISRRKLEQTGRFPSNKNNNRRSSQIPVLCDKVAIECCCWFHKENELKEKQGQHFSLK